MSKRIVLKVQMCCAKCRKKAMEIAASAEGVTSLKLEGDEKDQLVVVGAEVDSVCLARLLRKKVGHTNVISIEDLKPEGKEKEVIEQPQFIQYYHQYPQFMRYEPVYECDPPSCSIM